MISFSLLSLATVASAATIRSPAVSLAGSQTFSTAPPVVVTSSPIGTASMVRTQTAPVAVSKPATILGTSYIASPIQSVMPKAYVKETGTPLQYSYKVPQAPRVSVPTTPMVATRSIPMPIAQTRSYSAALPTTSYMIPTPAPTYTTTYTKAAPITTMVEPSPASFTREFLASSDDEEAGSGSGMEFEPTPAGKKTGCC